MASLVLLITCVICAILVYLGIKGLLRSKKNTVSVEGKVIRTERSRSAYYADVEYEYNGTVRTARTPTKSSQAGGLKEGDMTTIQVYEDSGEAYVTPANALLFIIFGSGVIIYIVGSWLNIF